MKFTNIKPEIYNSIGIENNPYCISQPFQINSSSDATIDFFKGIYSYPPKIKLKFNKLDDFSRFKNLSTTLLLQDSTLAVNDGVRIPHLSSRLGKSAKQMEVIPAYVVLNGQQELVVSSSYSNNSEFNQGTIVKGFKKVFSSNTDKASKLGFAFMCYSDAEAYLNDILNQWESNVSTVGLAVHCVSLASVYDIIHTSGAALDLRIVPNMNELNLLLNKYKGSSNLVFDSLQYQSRGRVRPLSFTPRIKNFYLGDNATPFYKFVSSNEYFKGVPIYVVQIHSFPRNIFLESGRIIFSSFDTLVSPVTDVIGTFLGIGERGIFQSSTKNLSKSNNEQDYIFFNYDQAKNFSKKHGRFVKRFDGGKFIKPGFLSKKPSIYVTNLEDYLELKDFLDVKNSTENSLGSAYCTRDFYFIPEKGTDKLFDNKILKSRWEYYLESLSIKGKLFKSVLSTLLEF